MRNHDGDVLHDLKLWEERATEIVNYLHRKYRKNVSSTRFRPLADGEDHSEIRPSRKNSCDRQIRLFSCGATPPSTPDDSDPKEPNRDYEDVEYTSGSGSDASCTEIDSSCSEYEDINCSDEAGSGNYEDAKPPLREGKTKIDIP